MFFILKFEAKSSRKWNILVSKFQDNLSKWKDHQGNPKILGQLVPQYQASQSKNHELPLRFEPLFNQY